MRPLVAAALATLLSTLGPARAGAELDPSPSPSGPVPRTERFHLSSYEQDAVDGALAALGLSLDPSPEGKEIEAIHDVRLEVIEDRDPAPRWLNVFHVLTQSPVIRRELLFAVGDRYRQTWIDETQRNLAGLPQLSLALLVAARGSSPDRVQVVIVTKDIWSIRLNWDIAYSQAGLESLTIDPTESNLLGTHQAAGVRFDWLPLSYSVAPHYSIPRLFGTRLAAFAQTGLVVDRGGAGSGSYGAIGLSHPLWSSVTPWAWDARFTWSDAMFRLYSGTRVSSFTLDPLTSCAAPSPLCVPFAYRARQLSGTASVTRSYGWSHKHDLSLGVQWTDEEYRIPDLSAYDVATAQAFRETRVPASDRRVGPILQYSSYRTDFVRVVDLETLALQEDERLGWATYLRFYPVLKVLGSSSDLLGVSAGASLSVAPADGLARAGVECIAEVEPGGGATRNGSVRVWTRLATPAVGAGRLVLDALLLDRYRNALQRTSALGGESRLRGYPTSFAVGADLLAVNLEARSRPVELLRTVQLAGAVFYDAGDAFDSWDRLQVWHAAGLGARVLFPQLDRIVFRADVGFPLTRRGLPGLAPAAVYVSFGQAFPVPDLAPRTAATL